MSIAEAANTARTGFPLRSAAERRGGWARGWGGTGGGWGCAARTVNGQLMRIADLIIPTAITTTYLSHVITLSLGLPVAALHLTDQLLRQEACQHGW